MAKKTTDFEIKVPGTEFILKSNTLYTVIPKPDDDAPDGFREHGTTKVIHPDISNTVQCPFDIGLGVWDTGFYEGSPSLIEMDIAEEKKFIENITKNIVIPIERIRGKGCLRHDADNTFFDDFVITLFNKETFNTADPLQLLGLYLAILGFNLTPKEDAGHPKYRESAYMVVNRDKEISNKDQKTIDKTKSIGEFYKLLYADKKKLTLILKYLGISSSSINDEDTFLKIFNNFLEDREDGYRNGNIFLKTLEKFKGDKEEELYIYETISNLVDSGEVKVFKNDFYFENTNLGASLKHAAAFVMVNDDIKVALTKASIDEETEDVEED